MINNRIAKLILNFLPYYFVKKIVLYGIGKPTVCKLKGNSDEYTARGYEIDYGEVLMISDKEQLLKHRKRIEDALKRNQRALDELEMRI